MRSLLNFTLAVALGLGAQSPHANAADAQKGPVLSLNSYLQSVNEGNDAVRAAQSQAKAANLYSESADLLTSPQAFGSVETMVDKKPNFQFGSTKTTSDAFNLGIQQQTSFGLSGKLYYHLDSFDMQGRQNFNAYSARPVLELSQPLLRNGFGSETRAQQEAAKSAALATSFGSVYKSQALLLDAEANYWKLALARETVQVQKEALERADRLFEWSNRRSSLGLADKADVLQAKANQQSRRLELRTSIDAMEAAARAFNSSRGSTDKNVPETLQPITPDLIEHMTIPAKIQTRLDVQAAEQEMRATQAQARLEKEKLRPSLDVYGSFAANGYDPTRSEAISGSFETDRPTTAIGIRFTAPLDLGVIRRAKEGRDLERKAAEQSYTRKNFEQDHDWNEITQKFQEAKERYKLYTDLEKMQKEKLDYERNRRRQGRTTTLQVLTFELDYEQAQFGRLRTAADVLLLNAQMKLYGVKNESR